MLPKNVLDAENLSNERSLRGFGMTLNIESGSTRHWVVGEDGLKRWADNGLVCGDDEAFANSLAERLYQAYGSARNWTRSEGKPMDRVLMHASK